MQENGAWETAEKCIDWNEYANQLLIMQFPKVSKLQSILRCLKSTL